MSTAGRFEHAYRAPVDPPDLRVAELARRQHGVVAHRQLVELGLSRGKVQRRIATGRLHCLHRGVYAVGHEAITWHGRLMAAVLACGPGAVASHAHGAALLGLRSRPRGPIHVTVACRNGRRLPGIRTHRVRALHPDDRAVHSRIPVTSVARVLLDLAGMPDRRELERAWEAAEREGLLRLRAVAELCERSPGRRGVKRLRALLADARLPEPTRSELERLFLRLCRGAALPAPAVNVLVEGYEVDALWPAERLVAELDGRRFHMTRAAFERDRARDASLQMAGYRVVRLTHRQLTLERETAVRTIEALLAATRG